MKTVSKVLSLVGALILCFALLPLNASASPAPLREISITYDFPEPRIEENWGIPPVKGDDSETKAYVSVTMEGLFQWSEAGLPVLPFKTAKILLPHQTDTQDMTVSYGNKITLPGSYLVELGQEPVPLSYEGEPTLPNPEIYDSSARFPEKVYSRGRVQSKRGYRILLVNLYPVEYIPQDGQLSYYESITIKVTLGAGEDEWLPGRGLRPGKEVVRGMVDNPQIISSYLQSPISSRQGSLLETSDYEYVIITNQDLEATPGPDNFQALRDEKISRGITATIVTTEWIYANYSGARPGGGEDNQTRIRNFITDAYTTWGTTYVLLGGDGDGADVGGESGDEIIPHRGLASVSGEIDYDIPADLYYACLDGTFDDDADGIYGEPNDGLGGGEVDLLAEVYVGRAPVDSQAEVVNFVRKTLAYQNISKTDENLSKVWMVGEYLGFGGVADWGGNYKDEIREGSGIYGYITVGFEGSIYSSGFEVSSLYDRDYAGSDWPTSAIIDVINGNAHLINHLGHASVGYVMKMVNPDVDGLTNDELCFIGYSQGCYSGSFDNRESPGSYSSYDCIAEHLTTEAHGAVAFIANSRFGWGVWYSTDGPSQHYDREFWDAILGEDILNIGIANQDSKEDNVGRIDIWVERYCYYEINLFGDPELSVKLAEKVAYASHNIDDSAGDGNGYPEPGESITMPVTLRNTSTDTAFTGVAATLSTTTLWWEIIFSEDFEGAWPDWEVGDSNAASGEDYWGQSSYWAYRGNHSAYCAEVSDISEQGYDNDMEAFMGRNVDLTAYDSATLSYSYWLNCEGYYDHLNIGYYDGSWHWVESYTGTSDGWVLDSMAIPVTATAVRFQFYSDFSITYEGAYIDDVVLTGYCRVPDPHISILNNSCEYGDIPAGGEAASTYGFDISPGCPSGHVVTFNLDITATNGGPWTSSFDVPIVEHYPISDIATVTTDPGSDYRPAIAETADGKMWVVWQSYRSGNSDIWYKTSSDGGTTWSDASQITTDTSSDYDPAIAQTADGKVWVVWESYRSGNSDIWYKTSSDGGATWSAASQVTTDPGDDYRPAIAETADGKIWLVWQSYRSGNPDIWYKTTKDGVTWSTAFQITTHPGSDYYPAIAETADGKMWVVWQSYRSGNSDIWYKTSSDGGTTWSDASQITTDTSSDYDPAIAQTADGKVWVVWESSRSEAMGYQPPPPAPLGGSDIWYKTSSDGGGSWSTASQFTKFSGSDVSPGADALSSGKLAVAWSSDRAVNYDVWYGIIGLMEDINPPPHLDWVENEPPHPDTEQVVTIRACASDESGVEDVQLVWWLDGTPQDNLPMYDDGDHNDYGAGDGVYGVQLGLFPTVGTVVQYQIQVTDIDNNLIVAPQYRRSFEVIEYFVKTADILLVEDGQSGYVAYYANTLDGLDYAYDYWDDDLRGNIDGETLNQYLDGIVIWATPSWGYISYSETRDNLASYLDNGGSLFISGQDIGYQIGSSSFYRDYLHAQYVQDNIGLYALSGVGGDPIGDGLYVYISGGDGANNQWYPSEIDPILPAVTIFTYDPGATMPLVEPSIPEEEKVPEPGEAMPEGSSAERGVASKTIVSSGSGAIRVNTGNYKVVYFSFGFEAINSAADRLTVMERVLNWLSTTEVSISAPDRVVPSSDFTATVDIGAVVDLNAVQYDVSFDNTALRLDDVTSGQIDGTEIPVEANEISPGTYRVLQSMGLDMVSGSGYLSTLHFHVIGSLGDSSLIGLSGGILSGWEAEIRATWTGHTVDVSVLPGDANGDDVVNVLDMSKVARIILQLDAETPGADANLDGGINVLDMTKIARIILQLD